MRTLIAIVCPPLGVLLAGRVMMAVIFAVLWVISLFLCMIGVGVVGWIILSIAAVVMVNQAAADKRHRELVKAVQR